MQYIKLNESGFADKSGYLRCYICHPDTREYLGESDEFISQHTGIPAWAFMDCPQGALASGMVWVRSTNGWEQVLDLRGQLAYDTVTRAASEIVELGPLPADQTMLIPGSPFDRWNGKAWVKDEAAEQQNKLEAAQAEQAKLIANATQQIAIIKPAVDGGYAKPEHTNLLSDWQRYRYELTLVTEHDGWPNLPQWPVQPAPVI
ncbi:tail fiber assembly protein [Aeromonas sp. QDB11]|uniref:tail fiber assembly protein n=1 Tax=Aeromonas sp. QDB11 TaxID=2990482 RepID=UPI0022E79659|nr:tail fiber assembly protein [Aeromonas sp. QDB11]